MRRHLRLLLCWLLLAALPLQGWAAVSMALCASVHPGMGVAGVRAETAATPHAPCHTHAQLDHHGAGHGTAAAPQATGPGADTAGLADPPAPSLGAGSCAMCAWCAHAVSSLPATGGACPAVAAGRAFEPVPRALPALSFLTPGLERPPR
jgi:hypothetical protein